MRPDEIRAGVRRLFRLTVRWADGAGADADAELESLLDEQIRYLIARGMSPDTARAEALARPDEMVAGLGN